jgi:hypothetical protein
MNVQTCGILNSSEFSAIVKKMSTLSERVEIQYTDEKLVLKRIGDSISQETIISNIERPEDADLTDPTEILQSSVSSTWVSSASASLSENMELYMKSDYPLIIRFHNVTLGELKLCLSPFMTNVECFLCICLRTH